MTERFSDLATPRATKSVLDAFDISLKKSLGQNFLVNDAVIGKILELAQLNGSDDVLEVGPGIGTLTSALLKIAAHVTSVEKDDSLPDVLERTLAAYGSKFTLIRKDALDLTVCDLAGHPCNKLIANLPYSVAATIILDYFERFSCIRSATVMVQKEVAERIAAVPGTKSYGAYTVKLSLFAGVQGSFNVSRNDFLPPPHVDSTVIKLDRAKAAAEGESADLIEAACTMADASFASRRKTIANSCKSYFASRGIEGKAIVDELPGIFASADIDPSIRGEKLTSAQFLRLGQALLDR